MTLWLLGGAALVGAFVVGCQWAVIRAGNGLLYSDAAKVPQKPVALVLGTSERLANGRTNRFFTYRIDAAEALYKAGKVRHLLLSGDNRSEDYDEPTRMKEALVKRGVPESAIVLDYAGLRTLDSVIRAKEVFGVEELTIVSQPFHNQRALFIAKHAGMDAIGFNAQDVSASGSLKVRAREAFARIRAVLDLYVLRTRPRFSGPPEPPIG